MSVLMLTSPEIGVQPKRWNKAEYYRLGELGFFFGRKVELIEGELIVHAPQGPPHAGSVDLVGDALRTAFGSGYRVRCQLPIDFGQTSEPEPDYVVVAGTPRQFLTTHPTSAELIVEVSDSSLSYDRRQKGSLYARAGVADYWIVNLVDNQVEVYRDPVADANEPYGFRYSSRTDYAAGSHLSPLALPTATISTADLLP